MDVKTAFLLEKNGISCIVNLGRISSSVVINLHEISVSFRFLYSICTP